MKASKSMRIWFAFMASVLWIGVYLTGFSNVNWVVYLPTVGFTFAALTGICPSQISVFKLMGSK